MIDNLYTILKYTIIQNLNTTKRKRDENNKIWILLLIPLGLVFWAAHYFYDVFALLEIEETLPVVGLILAILVTTITIIAKADDVLFKPKDMDMLMAMPISINSIFWAKFIYLYMISLYFCVAVTSIVLLELMSSYTISFIELLLGVLMGFISAAIPVTIGILISMFISYISTKFKNSKRVTSFLVFTFTAMVVVVPMLIAKNVSMKSMIDLEALEIAFKNYFYPGYLFLQGIRGDVLSVLLFAVVCLLPILIIITLLSRTYVKLIQKLSENYKTEIYVDEKNKRRNLLLVMYIKEIKKIFSNTAYFVNNALGSGILIFVALYILIAGDNIFNGISEMLGTEVVDFAFVAILATAMIGISITNTVSSSISLEGNNLWIYKSSPISTGKIFLSKILPNITINLISYVVLFVVSLCKYNFSSMQILFLIIIPILTSILISIAGLLVNLAFPLLNYKNSIQVIKRSTATLMSIAVGISIGGANAFLILKNMYDVNTILLIITIEFIELIAVSIVLLKYWGVKTFYKI